MAEVTSFDKSMTIIVLNEGHEPLLQELAEALA